MSKQKGYDKVDYDSGYEKEHRKRRDQVRNMSLPDSFYEGDGMFPEQDEPGFVERNNVNERL